MVIKKYENLFKELRPIEPPVGLYNKIILAIKKERDLQKRKRLLFVFFFILIISIFTMPFSWILLLGEIKNSGIFYFLSTALNNFDVFLFFWQDFSLAIIESLPIVAILIFMVNMVFLLSALRLFLDKKSAISLS